MGKGIKEMYDHMIQLSLHGKGKMFTCETVLKNMELTDNCEI